MDAGKINYFIPFAFGCCSKVARPSYLLRPQMDIPDRSTNVQGLNGYSECEASFTCNRWNGF